MDPIALLASLDPEERQSLLETMPALPAPNGTEPQFIDPPNANDAVIAIISLFLFLPIVLGLLRLYSRVFVTRIFRVEDYIGFFAYVPFVGIASVCLLITQRSGFLVDRWNLYLDVFLEWLKHLYILRVIYGCFMILSKSAILIEWIRIFSPKGTTRWFLWACRAMIAINTVTYLVAVLYFALSCIPARKIWQPWIEGQCVGRKDVDLATAWINLAIDFGILVMPQSIIWRLKMTWERKIGISITFAVGLLVVVCAVGRIHASTTARYDGNITRDGGIEALWCLGEATGVMIVWAIAGVPKAFAKQSWLGGILSSLRAWTRLGESFGDESKQRAGAPDWSIQTIGGSGPKGFRRGAGEKHSKASDTLEMDLMETRNQDDDAEYDHGPRQATESGIIKTIKVERRDDLASMSSREPIIERQHPWVA